MLQLDVFGGGSFSGKNSFLHQVDDGLIDLSDLFHPGAELFNDQVKFGTFSFEQSDFFLPAQLGKIELDIFEVVLFGLFVETFLFVR